MANRRVQSEAEVCEVLLETYVASDCMNQLLLEHLDPKAWRASPEGKNKREGRTLGSPRAGDHACASTGLQAAGQGRVWDLAVGEALEWKQCGFKTCPR
jgi:hypothetical protein